MRIYLEYMHHSYVLFRRALRQSGFPFHKKRGRTCNCDTNLVQIGIHLPAQVVCCKWNIGKLISLGSHCTFGLVCAFSIAVAASKLKPKVFIIPSIALRLSRRAGFSLSAWRIAFLFSSIAAASELWRRSVLTFSVYSMLDSIRILSFVRESRILMELAASCNSWSTSYNCFKSPSVGLTSCLTERIC